MAMRPVARGGSPYFAAADVALVRFLLEMHDEAGCDDQNCPVRRLGAFLAVLETQLQQAGDRSRAQLWASLFVLPNPAAAPQLEQRIPG